MAKGFVMRYRDEKFGEEPKEFNQSFDSRSLKEAEKKAEKLLSMFQDQAGIAMIDKKFTLLGVSSA